MSKVVEGFLKDPLVHFLLAGALVFVVANQVTPGEDAGTEPKTILIDRETLLTELQFRTKTFEPELAAKRLASLSPEALDQLVTDYVRSEVLYREANDLGFGNNDYIIKKRMIQKMDFIIQDLSGQSTRATRDDLVTHYNENQQDYLVPGFVTFTHVFIDGERLDPDAAMVKAKEMLKILEAEKVSFTQAPGFGDRFPFGLNYVEKPKDLVASHFGQAWANQVFQLKPAEGVWQGPIQSEHGAHLVMLLTNQPDRMPPLAEVEGRVRADTERKLIESQRLLAIDKLVEEYTIKNTYQPPTTGVQAQQQELPGQAAASSALLSQTKPE